MAQGNLAGNLTASAERFGERVALRLDDVELSYALLDEASARVAGLLAAKGVGPATASGSCSRTSRTSPSSTTASCAPAAVVVPMNVLLKGREVAFYLARLRGQGCCSPGTTSPRPREPGAEEAGAECILVEPGEFEELLGRRRAAARGRRPRRPTTPR